MTMPGTRAADETHHVTVGGQTIPLEIFTPPRDGRRPAVVVIHEIFGLNDDIRRIAARFADNGYVAAAPCLMSSGSYLGCIWQAVRSFQAGSGPAVDLLDAVVAMVAARPDVGKVGVVGFCIGGGFALLMGTRGAVDAAGTYYGDIKPREELKQVCPVMGGYGAKDRLFASKGRELIAGLEALGKEHDVRMYDDAGHSYMSDAGHEWLALLTRPLMHVEYNERAAEDSWRRMLAFFDRHLASPAAR